MTTGRRGGAARASGGIVAAAAGLILAVAVDGCTVEQQPPNSSATTNAPATALTAPPGVPGGDAIVTPPGSPTGPSPGPSSGTVRPRPSNQIHIDGQQAARSAAAAQAAGAFMRAFARPDLPEQAWWARVAPLLTQSGRHAAQGTDPARVPVTTITGKAVVLPGAEKDARTVRVPTDIGSYTLFLLYDAGTSSWLVQTYQPPPDIK